MGGKPMKILTPVEIILSYISLGWAFVLFTSPILFESSDSWNQLKAIASYEWVIGLIALICALTKIIGIALKNTRLRWIGLLMSTAFWISIAAGMLIAKGYIDFSTGFVVYSGIAVLSLWTSKEVKMGDATDQ